MIIELKAWQPTPRVADRQREREIDIDVVQDELENEKK